ncbi:MAG TPA: PAS domain S-box protein [Desulfotignum sp.]|nr:PAS domain S-box protein [Desulfotignum sp.]
MTESPDLHQPVMTIAHQDMVMLHEDHTVQQALDYIRQQGFGEKIIYFYVVSADGRLKGVILTRRLLTTPLEQRISEIMIQRLITSPHTASVMQAYDLLSHHNLLALPVVDPQQQILGVVDASTFTDDNPIKDIAQRKKEQLEIQRLHTRLRSILDHMRDLVLSFSYLDDFDKNRIDDFQFFDDHLVEINSSALSFYEVPASYILHKKISVFDFIYDTDKEKVLAHYIGLFEKGSAEITYRIITQRGQIKWVLDYGRVEYMKSGKVRRVNHIIEDITEKKQALDELQASEQKYRRIFELSQDMIYILSPEGQILDINPSGIRVLGLTGIQEARQKSITDFTVDAEAGKALVKEIQKKGETTKYRMLVQNLKGDTFEIGLNAIAQRDDTGKAVSYQAIAHNITEAIRQKELEAISQLAGCFADDLASPLNVILIGIDTFKTVLQDIEKIIKPLSDGIPAAAVKKIKNELQFEVSDAAYFLDAATVAVEDVTQRLTEIRDQYWRLKKVPDGTGGIIYQRATKKD